MTDTLSLCSQSNPRTPRNAVPYSSRLSPPKGFLRSDYGILLRKNWLDATFHFCRKGIYDRLLADYLQHQCQPFTFVDIGANQGLYSILAAHNMNCEKVVAFEPVASTFSLLKTNILVNQVKDIVTPIQAAVSLTTGHTQITKKFGHSGAASLRKLPGWFSIAETISTIGPDTLPTYVPVTGNLVVKVDVEGHEHVVFDALANAGLLSSAKAVFYEVNRSWSKENALEVILRDYGFTDFTRTSSKSCHDVLATR